MIHESCKVTDEWVMYLPYGHHRAGFSLTYVIDFGRCKTFLRHNIIDNFLWMDLTTKQQRVGICVVFIELIAENGVPAEDLLTLVLDIGANDEEEEDAKIWVKIEDEEE